MKRVAAALAAAALALTACGGGAAPPNPDDVLACQHFKAQGERFKHIAAPTLVDDAQVVGWVREDAALAHDPALKRDLDTWARKVSAYVNGLGTVPAPVNVTAPIRADCRRAGVKI